MKVETATKCAVHVYYICICIDTDITLTSCNYCYPNGLA